METIKIPSPSAILDSQPPASSTDPARRPSLSGSPSTPKKTAARQSAANAVTTKPKQSKSRNGCITCKTKRLKCDESKPTCLQCKKRSVECGGYKKDFKWRPFEETNIACKVAAPKAKKVSSSPPSGGHISSINFATPPSTEKSSKPNHGSPEQLLSGNPRPSRPWDVFPELESPSSNPAQGPVNPSGFLIREDDVLNTVNPGSLDEEILAPSLAEMIPSAQSPWLSDISLPTDLGTSPDQSTLEGSVGEQSQRGDNFSFAALLEGDNNDDVEEIVRNADRGVESELRRLSDTTTSPNGESASSIFSFLKEPNLGAGSPEMLVVQFDRFTCGILSVKDGVHENPWRTLIWPLAKDTPALAHAIFSLAAFHSSKQNPGLRVHGVDHMRQSITCMVQDIQNMRADAALATSLALAFAETWDQHTRTCIQHLRGAKALVSQVVEFGLQSGVVGADLDRVRFLYNTWLYMDVMAHLTSREECGDQDMDFSILQFPRDAVHEIDPLMGCAATLFPIIDRVARLIQLVRKTTSNSLSLVSEAIELKRLVSQWEPPAWFEPPEDPTSEVQHSIQIAHAYRWATLLYLHQAVPEMPCEPAPELAKRILILLATVPPSSRTTIIQMFPLLAAGCEAEQGEDRQWVLNRWAAVQTRLMLGSIDRCIDVVQEVWARRDAFDAEKQRQSLRPAGRSSFSSPERGGLDNSSSNSSSSSSVFAKEPWRRAEDWAVPAVPSTARSGLGQQPRRSSAVSPLANIEFERTVRGSLHWITVMQEWGWEVFLG